MTAHRYWRLFIADNFEPYGANRYYTSLTELEMFTTVGGSNVCTGGTAIASSDFTGSGWSMNNAFDGAKNVDIGWAANNVAPPAWIGYDFGAGNEKDIVQYSFTVRSHAGSMTQSPRIFTLQYSDDGIEWFSSDGAVIKSTLWNANESLTKTTSMHFSATKRFTPVVRQFDSSTASIYAAQNCFKGDSDISGTIRVEGDEIENAVVHLKDATTGLHLRSTLTNVLGDYEFKNLRRDKLYDVVAEDPLKEWEKVVSSRRTPFTIAKIKAKIYDGARAIANLVRESWGILQSWTPTTTNSGWNNYTLRCVWPNTITASKVRVTFSSGPTACAVSAAYIGNKSGAYGISSPSSILVGGLSTFTIPSNSDVVSDELTIALTGDIVLSCHLNSGDVDQNTSVSGMKCYYRSGNDASNTSPVSYDDAGANGYFLTKIEIFGEQ